MKFCRFVAGLYCLFSAVGISVAQDQTEANSVDINSETPLPLEELRTFTEAFVRIKAAYVEEVSDEDLIESAIGGMLAGLDPHSVYLDPDGYDELQTGTSGKFGGLGIEIVGENGYIKIVSPIDDTPAERAGLLSGDLIVSIDGQSLRDTPLQEAVDMMRGDPGTAINLTIVREGENAPFDVELERAVIKVRSVRSRTLEPGYGYIRISQFQASTAETLRAQIRNMMTDNNGALSGLIVDLRNNPGGLLNAAVSVSDAFLKEGKIVSTQGRTDGAKMSFDASPTDQVDGAPIVVLVNGGSASASEIVAGALQDHRRALVVGTKTFGKGSVQTILPVHGSGAIKLTTARYYTPHGRSIQAEGIEPDILVERLEVTRPESGPRVREADLRGHLDNEENLTAAGDENDGEITDYQLNEALNLLKAIALSRASAVVEESVTDDEPLTN
ncbi:MAG: S41 family peptidase [Proteobacteria bacterium]|jgi:carboxyl-terminal processing protease|nr:S41 family peptidase [Pseudomonadota bacterium]